MTNSFQAFENNKTDKIDICTKKEKGKISSITHDKILFNYIDSFSKSTE